MPRKRLRTSGNRFTDSSWMTRVACLFGFSNDRPASRATRLRLRRPRLEQLEQRQLLAGDSVTFAVLGDYGDNSADEAAVADMVKSWSPDLILTTGDNNYGSLDPGSLDWSRNVGFYYGDYIQSRSDGKYVGQTGSEQRFFPSVGNHDSDDGGGIGGGSGGDLTGYLDYFNEDPAGDRLPAGVHTKDNSYYDFEWGPIRFFSIDSDAARVSNSSRAAQQEWLEQGLANSTSEWNFVFFHHSPFSSSGVHGSDPTMQWAFAEWGADAIFSGHDHTYERIIQDEIPYFVTGLGGRSIYPFSTPVAGSEARYNDDYGAMRVTVDDDRATFEFLAVTGSEVTDTYVIDRGPDSGAVVDALRITEVMYNPVGLTGGATGADLPQYEYIELRNEGAELIDISEVVLSGSVQFNFADADDSQLNPGERVIIASDRAAFGSVYALSSFVIGEFTGDLGNDGDVIRLTVDGTVIHDFAYSDQGDWPELADGFGASLEVIDLDGNYNDGTNWRSSTGYNGSPGFEDFGPQGDIIVNEILSSSGGNVVDAIELYNRGSFPVRIDGWYLSNSSDNYRKFKVPSGTILNPGGYVVFDESDFNRNGGGSTTDFVLDGLLGGEIWVMATGVRDDLSEFIERFEYGPSKEGETLGRYPNGTGELMPLAEATWGRTNSAPRVGPVIMSELMYHIQDVDNVERGDREFVEIYNATGDLIDLTNWQLAGGINYTFVDTQELAPRSVLVVVSFDPADTDAADAFRDSYGVGNLVTLVGPYEGDLANDGERVELLRALENLDANSSFVPLVREDVVTYDEVAPWPVAAAGGGLSLTRTNAAGWGDDPASWKAAAASPGTVPFGAPLARPDIAKTTAGFSASISVLLNDSACPQNNPGCGAVKDLDSIVVVQMPEYGTTTVESTGRVTYRSDIGYKGIDTFRYTFRNSDGVVSNDAVVTVNISLPVVQWQNPGNRFDIDKDGIVNSLDLVKIIRDLNENGPRALPLPPIGGPELYLDISGDNRVNAVDLISLIRELNRIAADGEAEPFAEGEFDDIPIGVSRMENELGASLLWSTDPRLHNNRHPLTASLWTSALALDVIDEDRLF